MSRSNFADGASLRRLPDLLTLLCGFGALVLLLIEFGFPLDATDRHALILAVRLVLWMVAGLQILRLVLDSDWNRSLWPNIGRIAVYAGILLLLAIDQAVVPCLQRTWPHISIEGWEGVYLTTLHVAVLGLLARRLLQFNQILAFARISPRAILIASYVGLILAGTALLKLPNATNGDLGWIDALFSSTSAVCVTGLIVVDTATVFTSAGQTILLGLFQLGGLGLMTFTYFFVALFGSGITIKDRALLLEFLNEEYVGRVTGSLIAIVLMTLAFEAAGAVMLQVFTPGEDWFSSVFHSVSAFCNAGFSVYSDGLYDPITRSNVPYQSVIMLLIIIGGLGFPVLKNVWDNLWVRTTNWQQRPPRITTHTKLVLVTTGALVVGGAVLIYVLEYSSALQPTGRLRWVEALFTSITSRTAGFNTVPVDAEFGPAGRLYYYRS